MKKIIITLMIFIAIITLTACSGPSEPKLSILPKGGFFEEGQNVTLEVTNAGDVEYNIYYTLDGSEPTVDSIKYTDKIKVDNNGANIKTLKAMATPKFENNGDKNNLTKEETYKFVKYGLNFSLENHDRDLISLDELSKEYTYLHIDFSKVTCSGCNDQAKLLDSVIKNVKQTRPKFESITIMIRDKNGNQTLNTETIKHWSVKYNNLKYVLRDENLKTFNKFADEYWTPNHSGETLGVPYNLILKYNGTKYEYVTDWVGCDHDVDANTLAEKIKGHLN